MASFSNYMQEEQRRKQEMFDADVETFALPPESQFEEITPPVELDLDSSLQLLEQDLIGEMRSRDLQREEDLEMTQDWLDYATPVIKSWESFRDTPYYATEKEKEKGILTVGYGQTEGVTEDTIQTEEEATEYLQSQLSKTRERLSETLGDSFEILSPAQQAAVASLAYNVDKDVVGQFKRSKAFKALKAGDLDEFIYQAFDPEEGFVKQGGEILEGLQRRRAAEQNLFLYGDEFDVASLDNQFLNV